MRQVLLKSLRRVALAATALAVTAAGAHAVPVFTNWTAADLTANTASGTLGGASVFLQSSDVNYAVTNGSTNEYSFATQYAPALALSDSIGIGSHAITPTTTSVSFSAPVTDVIIHISSLASTLTFTLPDNTPIPVLYVSGSIGPGGVVANQVIGQLVNIGPTDCPSDRCGTIKLIGTFTAFNFSAFYHTWPGGAAQPIDGVDFQIGAESVALQGGVPAPGTLALLGLCLLGLGATRRKT